jgi:predicted nucleic acid-binding protein
VKIFIDTSSLIKLYFREDGTTELDKLFSDYSITEIFLSELTKIEFSSAIYKKVRTGDLQAQNARDILNAFVSDESKYQFILLDSEVISSSQKLIEKYGVNGLRSLDAIQLASACTIKGQIDFAISTDKLLNQFLIAEGFAISPQ